MRIIIIIIIINDLYLIECRCEPQILGCAAHWTQKGAELGYRVAAKAVPAAVSAATATVAATAAANARIL